MQVGLTASTVMHVSVLALALVSFSGARTLDAEQETVPVDIVSNAEFSKMTKGLKTAKQAEKPKQVAEKVDTPTPVEDPKTKVSDKPPVEATAPPPPPPPAPPQPKVDEKPPVPKAAEAAPKAEPKADESLKAQAPKDEPKPDTAPKEVARAAPIPPKKPAIPKDPPKPVESQQPSREFSADQIKDLIDKRTPQRRQAAGEAISQTASLGTAQGGATELSQTYKDRLRNALRSCWNRPPFEQDGFRAVVRFALSPDGSVMGMPDIVSATPASSPYMRAFAESARRAVLSCSNEGRFTFLPRDQYDQWREWEIGFSPLM